MVEVVEYELHMLAHNGSSFDTYIILNNLPKVQKNCKYYKKR